MNYLEILKKRRSVYQLSNRLEVSDKVLENMLKEIIVESPTGFNMQSEKIVVLMDDEHRKLWDITTAILKEIVPEDKFAGTQAKMNMFKAAKGTILFFEDEEIIQEYQKEYALYKDNFPTFAAHSMGILQGNIWNALADKEIGANLQHYNPLIDDAVKKEWKLPQSYRLEAQMVFGKIVAKEEAKDKIPAEERMKVIK